MLSKIRDLSVVLSPRELEKSDIQATSKFSMSLLTDNDVFIVLKKTPCVLSEIKNVCHDHWVLSETYRHDIIIKDVNLGRKQIVIRCDVSRVEEIQEKQIRTV